MPDDQNQPISQDDQLLDGAQYPGDAPAQDDTAANSPGGSSGGAVAADQQATAGQDAGQGSAAKDPDDWTTGDEPATPAQKSYISTMAVEAGQQVPTELTKAEASKLINELQEKTGRDTSSERP